LSRGRAPCAGIRSATDPALAQQHLEQTATTEGCREPLDRAAIVVGHAQEPPMSARSPLRPSRPVPRACERAAVPCLFHHTMAGSRCRAGGLQARELDRALVRLAPELQRRLVHARDLAHLLARGSCSTTRQFEVWMSALPARQARVRAGWPCPARSPRCRPARPVLLALVPRAGALPAANATGWGVGLHEMGGSHKRLAKRSRRPLRRRGSGGELSPMRQGPQPRRAGALECRPHSHP